MIIKTDQQRADTINALGASHMITPNMDRLVNEGVSFTNAFCCGATCISSRVAFYTGRFAHNTGVYSFDDWADKRTWLHDLKDAGYHLSDVGKVHHQPCDAQMAYDERVIAENFPMFTDYDDFSNYLKAEGQENPCKLHVADGKWLDKCVSQPYPLDEKYHVDNFLGRMACHWIDSYDKEKPFFLHVGFVGPHDPYDPPKRFLDMYKDVEIPAPVKRGDEFETKPPQYKRFMEQCLREPDDPTFTKPGGYGVFSVRIDDKTDEQLLEMRRHYYAKITHIDEQIGKIMKSLEEKGLLDNTIVVFTADHGDNLADHGMMYKWLMTEQSTKVPMVVRMPGKKRFGIVDEDLFTQMDVGPTLLDFAGLEVPCYLDGSSNLQRIASGDKTQVPEKVYCEDNYLTMVRTKTHRFIHYAGQNVGEYYDIINDPYEFENLYDDPEYQDDIVKLKLDLLEWRCVSRYLGSALNVGLGPKPKRYWPGYIPEDPYILSGPPRHDRTRIGEETESKLQEKDC